MNRKDLVNEIVKRRNTGLNKRQIDSVLVSLIDIIGDLPSYDTLVLRNLGTFYWGKNKACSKVNPNTGERYVTPATIRMKLKAHKSLVKKQYK